MMATAVMYGCAVPHGAETSSNAVMRRHPLVKLGTLRTPSRRIEPSVAVNSIKCLDGDTIWFVKIQSPSLEMQLLERRRMGT